MSRARSERAVRALARECGVQLAYSDIEGRRREASTDAVLAVLIALGVVDRVDDVDDARRHKQGERADPIVEPLIVAWDAVADLKLRVPRADACDHAEIAVETDDGESIDFAVPLDDDPGARPHEQGDRAALTGRLPATLPVGTHRLSVRVGRSRGTSHLVVAPTHTWADDAPRAWGVFAPVYALHDGPDLGTGHFGHLARLGSWLAARGGGYVATLPLLPTFLHEPFDPSPYAPVSRRHWNEALLDPSAIPEAGAPCIGDLRAPPPLVDWRAVGVASNRLLTEAVARLDSSRAAELDEFLAAHPDVARYARFRAGVEATHATAPRARATSASPDPAVERRHAYGQWQAYVQVAALVESLAGRGVGLLLDLPVGTHPMGYDVWDAPQHYVSGVSVGAPPDDFFRDGQRWGFPPLRPEAGARDGYRRLRAELAHHMEPAAAVRIDHVMGLHRLFWIPDGFEPRDGVYVRYPAEAQWATISAASHRHRCRVIGEDLGTVPASVRSALARHRALRTWVGELALTDAEPTPRPPRRSVASLSTHDTATFTAWWTDDRHERLRRAIRNGVGIPDDTPRPALRRLLEVLGTSPAELVLVALDDLWGETAPQNLPGTSSEAPNWRRRHARSLTDLERAPELAAVLEPLAASRGGRG